ncbi:arsenate reductase (glutaredoxin) [Ectothiorhodospiraceae bacterium WFHF3C12]|nr:arsenate reductase (glutaredoxin) [Ectothiorhodospiraceae bacterium WFHF3C12]
MTLKILHNPRCSKSRQTLALLREKGHEPLVQEYLKTPPTTAELDDILNRLGLEPRALIRRQEAEYKDNGLDNPDLDRDALIAAMVRHPRLIERPIVLNDDKAALGRPPEAVLDIL